MTKVIGHFTPLFFSLLKYIEKNKVTYSKIYENWCKMKYMFIFTEWGNMSLKFQRVIKKRKKIPNLLSKLRKNIYVVKDQIRNKKKKRKMTIFTNMSPYKTRTFTISSII